MKLNHNYVKHIDNDASMQIANFKKSDFHFYFNIWIPNFKIFKNKGLIIPTFHIISIKRSFMFFCHIRSRKNFQIPRTKRYLYIFSCKMVFKNEN